MTPTAAMPSPLSRASNMKGCSIPPSHFTGHNLDLIPPEPTEASPASSFPPFALLLQQRLLNTLSVLHCARCQGPSLPSGASCVMVQSCRTCILAYTSGSPLDELTPHSLISLSNLPIYTEECCSQRGEWPRQDTAGLQTVNSTESRFFLTGSSGSALVVEVAEHFHPLEGSSQPPSAQILPHPGESALCGLLCSQIQNPDTVYLPKMSLANQAKY